MFGRKKEKEEPRRKGGGEALMAQMGFMPDMSQMDSMVYGSMDDDDDLERELLALQGEDPPAPGPKPKKGPINPVELDRMIAASMKDVGSDDEDVSDTEDPDLLAELDGLAANDEPPIKMPSPRPPEPQQSAQNMVTLLQDRMSMYKTSQENCNANGETSKARRLDRGVKTLEDLLKKAKAGRPVNDDDIPPPVVIASKTSTPSTPSEASSAEPSPKHAPQVFEPTIMGATGGISKPSEILPPSGPPPLSAEDAEKHKMLIGRRDEYKVAALKAKRSGDLTAASKYVKTAKQFDAVLVAIEDGKPVDLSNMPPPPSNMKPERDSVQGASAAASPPEPEEELPETSQEDKQKLYKAPTEVSSIGEALAQRLEKYKATADAAKTAGESGKARRMGRIVKQYEDAIKARKAGKAVNYEELPAPPGFPPIPLGGAPSASQSPAAVSPPAPTASQRSPAAAAPAPPPHTASLKKSVSRAEHQRKFLQDRQLQYKTVALKAKKANNIEAAKKYMKIALGFNQMISALEEGRPVNMSEIPGPPPGYDKIEGFMKEDDSAADTPSGDRNEMYTKLEQDLIKQIKMAASNADHFTKLGNVASATQFQTMEKNARRDLDSLKNAYKYGDPVPRFHYETKQFSIVQSCTDLASDEIDLVVVRGINYNLPADYSAKDLDTYVTFEFPYPKDEPQKGNSETEKGSVSPEYNQSFKLKISRKSTVFLRFVKSKAMKLDVYYKRGFFKSDKLLGSVTIKLQPLENKCIFHDSYDLMDGRKAVGGKLEVKLRAREPFVGKQVDQVKEKWLVIDQFIRNIPPEQRNPEPVERRVVQGNVKAAAPVLPVRSTGVKQHPVFSSMEVLKYEKQLLDRQIEKLQSSGKLSPSDQDALLHKSRTLAQKVEEQREILRKGGVGAMKAYVNAIERTGGGYQQEAHMLVQQGQRDKAQTMLNKKKLVEKEVEVFKQKLQKM